MKLREIKPLGRMQQEPRRWFTSHDMDLTVWLAPSGLPTGFQFCYGKGHRERALTWRADSGFGHHAVDDGQTYGRGWGTPLLTHVTPLDAPMVVELFAAASVGLPQDIRRFVSSRMATLEDWWRTMTTLEQNREVVRAYVEAFNRGDLDALKALFAPDAEVQGVLGAGIVDKSAVIWQQLIEGLGINLTIVELVAEGDRVAARITERGVFQGRLMGHEPTGRSYELVAIEWFVIRDGRIARHWGVRDGASQARQIGLPIE